MVMAKVPIHNRILTCPGRETEFLGEPAINLSDDTVFEFLSEEYEGLSPASSVDDNIADDDEETDNRRAADDNFWENQHELLQSTLCRTTSLESKIRNITKEAIKDAENINACDCGGGGGSDGCRNCLMEVVGRRLQNAGFNSAICKSKWKSSDGIPSGEHKFVDVVDNANPKKEVRVIVELSFRAQFEMARASEEYNKLVKRLPEIFVGKIERLMGLLKILCGAAKKCTKERKMHMGPWRKHRYMQAKWLRTCERLESTLARPLLSGYSSRAARPRMSMLTIDLMESLSSLHRPAVAVV